VKAVALAAALAACGPVAAPSETGGTADAAGAAAVPAAVTAATTAARRAGWAAKGCASPEMPAELAGRRAETLLAENGRPAGDSRFVLGTGITPDRQVLLNALPMRGNERTPVREMVWIAGGCRLATWLVARDGTWVSVQALVTSATAEF